MQKIGNYRTFKSQIMEPDFEDFMRERGSLRKAWHCAGSLFHMHDWVYVRHKAAIDANYTFKDDAGRTRRVENHSQFANALGQRCSEFQIIRGVANSSKHFELLPVPPGRINPPGMPSSAANTYVVATAFQPGAFQEDAFQTGEVQVEADPGPLEFAPLAQSVLDMWNNLIAAEGW